LKAESVPVVSRASSGETRTFLLAWTLAEMTLMAEAAGNPPVLAFDDFDSEWDPRVLGAFAEALPEDGQSSFPPRVRRPSAASRCPQAPFTAWRQPPRARGNPRRGPVRGARGSRRRSMSAAEPGVAAPNSGDDYGAASIKLLKGLEAVRKRPGMLHREHRRHHGPAPHGEELVDNAIDEAQAGYCDTISRRRPCGRLGHRRGQRPRHSGRAASGPQARDARIILTDLHSGGKFDDNAYRSPAASTASACPS